MTLPPDRSINNPFFSIRESNEILSVLKRELYARGIHSNKYGSTVINPYRDERYIVLRTNQYIPSYSIIIAKHITIDTGDIHAIAKGDGYLTNETHNPDNISIYPPAKLDTYIPIYCTNGSLAYNEYITSSSSSSSSSSSNSSSSSSSHGPISAGLRCHIIGTHRPHLIRYNPDDEPYGVGNRVRPMKDNSGRIEKSTTGQFTCVSVGDTNRKLVWIVGHHSQLSYIPWVRTTTDTEFPDYPTAGNTFVVERGLYYFNDDSPGNKELTFIPAGPPREIYIAISPCGYLAQGSIRRMTFDNGKFYLMDDCDAGAVAESSSSSYCVNNECVWISTDGLNWDRILSSDCGGFHPYTVDCYCTQNFSRDPNFIGDTITMPCDRGQ